MASLTKRTFDQMDSSVPEKPDRLEKGDRGLLNVHLTEKEKEMGKGYLGYSLDTVYEVVDVESQGHVRVKRVSEDVERDHVIPREYFNKNESVSDVKADIRKRDTEIRDACETLVEGWEKKNRKVPDYTVDELRSARRSLKTMGKKLPDVTQMFSDPTPYRDLKQVKTWEKKIATMCKRFQKKYGKPFPLCLWTEDDGDSDYRQGVSGRCWLDGMRIGGWHSFRNAVTENRIGLEAYVTLTVERIAEVVKEKFGETPFRTLSVMERVSCICDAHNDFQKAYVWVGYVRPSLRLLENRNGDPVIEIQLPFQNGDYCFGDKLTYRLETVMKDEYMSSNYFYYNTDCDFPKQMLVGWNDDWMGLDEEEKLLEERYLELNYDD